MAWEEIVDYTVPSNTTSVTLNNFGTITKDDFIKVLFTIKNNNTSSNAQYFLYPNTTAGVSGFNTTSNYHRQGILGSGSVIAAYRENNAILDFVNPNGGFQYFTTYFKLSENNKANYFVNASSRFMFDTNGVENRFTYITSSNLTFNDPITSFNLETNLTNGLGANSRIQIYRLTAEKVADINVTSNTTQVDITGLDIKKGDEYLLVSDVNYTSSTADDLHLFINNNLTLNNYNRQAIFGVASSAGANRNASPSYIYTNGNTKTMAYTHIKLSNIGAYTYQSYNINDSESSNIFLHNFFGSSTAENITSINALNIRSVQSNAIGATTRFELYKLYEGGN